MEVAMTQLLLRAIRRNPDIRVFAELPVFRRPVAHWERGDDGVLRCVWNAC